MDGEPTICVESECALLAASVRALASEAHRALSAPGVADGREVRSLLRRVAHLRGLARGLGINELGRWLDRLGAQLAPLAAGPAAQAPVGSRQTA